MAGEASRGWAGPLWGWAVNTEAELPCMMIQPRVPSLGVLVSPSKEGTGLIGAAGAITQFLRLTFLWPIERFLAQLLS